MSASPPPDRSWAIEFDRLLRRWAASVEASGAQEDAGAGLVRALLASWAEFAGPQLASDPAAEVGPPAHWLERARPAGPPAHWIEYIRERAPHLLGEDDRRRTTDDEGRTTDDGQPTTDDGRPATGDEGVSAREEVAEPPERAEEGAQTVGADCRLLWAHRTHRRAPLHEERDGDSSSVVVHTNVGRPLSASHPSSPILRPLAREKGAQPPERVGEGEHAAGTDGGPPSAPRVHSPAPLREPGARTAPRQAEGIVHPSSLVLRPPSGEEVAQPPETVGEGEHAVEADGGPPSAPRVRSRAPLQEPGTRSAPLRQEIDGPSSPVVGRRSSVVRPSSVVSPPSPWPDLDADPLDEPADDEADATQDERMWREQARRERLDREQRGRPWNA